jgi:hypothetical protein
LSCPPGGNDQFNGSILEENSRGKKRKNKELEENLMRMLWKKIRVCGNIFKPLVLIHFQVAGDSGYSSFSILRFFTECEDLE